MKSPALRIALLLIAIASLRIVATYRTLSHTTDEPAHLATGIEWIQNGTYTYEDQHPPLARVAGALGIYVAGSRWSHNPNMYDEGYHLLGEHNRYNRALFYSRLFMLPFFWVAAAVVWLWGFRIGGSRTALFATLLFTTTPPVLAHAGLVTTDMALTAFVTATLLASIYWAEKPTWQRSIVFGVTLALALLSKFSTIAFLPAAWLLMCLANLPRLPFRRIPRLLAWATVTLATAALIVWAGYRFHIDPFFTGIQHAREHNTVGHLAYLLGQRSQMGFWYYYPVVLSVKTPVAMLILLVIAIAVTPRTIAMPLALIAALLAVGLFSHINIGVRHILPIYTGIALCGGVAFDYLFRTDRKPLIAAASALLIWQIATGALVHPDYLAYTNELAGRHPERILADSDLDWDQGMRGLALRLQELGVHTLNFKLNSASYMIANGHSFPPYQYMPDGDTPPPGWNAVCITSWKTSGQPKWADRIEPKERIHRSIYLYYFPPPKTPNPQ